MTRFNVRAVPLCAVALCVLACVGGGETTGDDGGGGDAVGAGVGAGPGAGAGGSTGSSTASTMGEGGQPNVTPEGLPDVGTLVVLGDSIGDGGGQGPYYYDLLRDALSAHYGKAIEYRNRADGGSKTDALLGQVQGLPSTLPGPVAVTITSGGNDMKDQLVPILTGSDGPARTAMGDNIDAALAALLAPDRFGPGTAVHVFYANIYDASDGEGNFQTGGCTISVNSPSPTDPFFESWNGEIQTRVTSHAQHLVDMHGYFYTHGFNNPPSWYAGDCTHPNTTGHDQLQQLFFSFIAGE